jgi:tRNA(Ile)-lysidine synthase TilS/MesJ
MKISLPELSVSCSKQFVFFSDTPSNSQLVFSKPEILCTLSGGQDSQLMFYIFLNLRKYIDFKVLYCHHFWQLSNFFCFWEIWKNTYLFQIPLCIVFTEKRVSTEEYARTWRQENFVHISKVYGINTLSIGHTASDQIETAFSNLVRGTSPKGLCNLQKSVIFSKIFSELNFMKKNTADSRKKQKTYQQSISKITHQVYTPGLIHNRNIAYKKNQIFRHAKIQERTLKRPFSSLTKIQYTVAPTSKKTIKFIRPLLDFHRSEITVILKQNSLPVISDPTNQSFDWTRNRFRTKFIPFLRHNVNTFFDLHFHQFLTINNSEQKFLRKIRTKILQNSTSKRSIETISTTLQQQLIHEILESYSYRQIEWIHVENIYRKLSTS